MNDLVSVIVPVYNVEKYLAECIESIINQTYRRLEIILVDDGSPDKCGEICDGYAEADKRIRVIHKKNTGVADSRNVGLKNCSGGYVYFLDSDDVLKLNCIEILISTASEYNADMVCADCLEIDELSSVIKIYNRNNDNYIMDPKEAMIYYAKKEWSPWNKLIKTEIHEDIQFPNYKIHEDESIKFKLLSRCQTVVQLNAVTYQYRQRSGSITDINSGTDRTDMFYSRRENYGWLKQNYPEMCKYFIEMVCVDAVYNLGLLLKSDRTVDIQDRIDEICTFIKTHIFEIVFGKYVGLNYKLRSTIILLSNMKKHNSFYEIFYRKIGKW